MPVARLMSTFGDEPLYFDFIRWDGPPPPLVVPHIETFTVAGIDGIGARRIGSFGDSFTVRATGVFAVWGSIADRTLFTAERAAYRHRELIGQKCKLAWEGIDYGDIYETQYLVENVVIDEIKRHLRLLGPTYNLALGAVCTATFMMRPVWVGSPSESVPVPLPGADGPNNPPLE